MVVVEVTERVVGAVIVVVDTVELLTGADVNVDVTEVVVAPIEVVVTLLEVMVVIEGTVVVAV